MATSGSNEPVSIFDFQALTRLDSEHALEQPAADEEQQAPFQVEAVFDWGFFHRAEQRATVRRRNLRTVEAIEGVAVQAGPGSVLVVEDDRAIRELMCKALTEQGLTVESAASGEQALTRMNEQRPSLVLLDMRLPGISGEDVAGGIRARFDGRVPIVVMSAFAPSDQVQRLNPDAYLDKPFQLEDLFSTVERVLARV